MVEVLTNDTFRFGWTRVPDGKYGKWVIDSFTVKDNLSLFMQNARYVRDGFPEFVVRSGDYRRLLLIDKTMPQGGCIVMSNTPMELMTCRVSVDKAKGRVLVGGLGMGIVLEAMLRKPEVEQIVVVERDAQLLRLVGKHYRKEPKIKLVQCDLFEYEPDGKFDFGWYDIWNDVSDGNLDSMSKLKAKFKSRVKSQACWAENLCKRMARMGY